MANQYDVGRVIRVSGSFATNTGYAFDPTNVFVAVKTPARVTTIYQYGSGDSVKKSAVGAYYLDVDTTLPGLWYYRWYSTEVKTSGQAYFKVRKVQAQ